MLRAWSDSRWKERLHERLEPLLMSKELAREISTYQGVPFALFAYPPTAERELRREVQLLATRVETETGRAIVTISMADLLWEAVRAVYPPDGKALFEAERSFSYDEPEKRLEMLETDMARLLSEDVPITKLISERAAELDPGKSILFLTRVGALFPVYRASALLENLMRQVSIPTILFYPGTRSGTNSLRFMDSLDAIHSYRHKIF